MVASLLIKIIRRASLFTTMGTCALFAAPGTNESNLVTNSPFLPPGWGEKAPEPVKPPEIVAQGPLSRELEFRGIFEMNGVTKFSVFDKAEQKGQWVPLNGGDSKYTIVRYNEPKKSIMVKSSGRLEEIFLLAPDDKAMPVIGSAPMNTPNRAQRGNAGNTNIPAPPNALLNQRNTNNRSGTTVPRRRIIRRSSSGNTATTNNTSTNNAQLPSNIPPPPNFTPGPPPSAPPASLPPSFTPQPPPATN